MNAILAKFESIWTALVAEEHKLADELRGAIDGLIHHQAANPAPDAQAPAQEAQPVAEASAKVEAAAPATAAPVQPQAAPAIDYAKYAGDTPFTIETQRFPNGLPPAWSWADWSKASGQPDPTKTTDTGPAPSRAGFNLDTTNPAVNPFPAKGQAHVFTFTGDGKVKSFQVETESGSQFRGFDCSVNGAPAVRYTPAGSQSYEPISISTEAGKPVSVDLSGFDVVAGANYAVTLN